MSHQIPTPTDSQEMLTPEIQTEAPQTDYPTTSPTSMLDTPPEPTTPSHSDDVKKDILDIQSMAPRLSLQPLITILTRVQHLIGTTEAQRTYLWLQQISSTPFFDGIQYPALPLVDTETPSEEEQLARAQDMLMLVQAVLKAVSVGSQDVMSLHKTAVLPQVFQGLVLCGGDIHKRTQHIDGLLFIDVASEVHETTHLLFRPFNTFLATTGKGEYETNTHFKINNNTNIIPDLSYHSGGNNTRARRFIIFEYGWTQSAVDVDRKAVYDETRDNWDQRERFKPVVCQGHNFGDINQVYGKIFLRDGQGTVVETAYDNLFLPSNQHQFEQDFVRLFRTVFPMANIDDTPQLSWNYYFEQLDERLLVDAEERFNDWDSNSQA